MNVVLLMAVLALICVILAFILFILLLQGGMKTIGCIGRMIGYLGRGLASLWKTAFPPPDPPSRPSRRQPSDNLLFLLKAAEAISAQHAAEKAKSIPSPPSPPPKPLRTLPQSTNPGEHFLYVHDILVTVRENNGEITFETDPADRWHEAISWLQDEGLMDKIVNKTFRWGDPQAPNN
jgi:hypothetical protein